MSADIVTAAAAGTWHLGDLTVNRMGFGAMRLTQNGPAFAATAAPSDRSQVIAVLRQAVGLGVNHIDTAAFYFSAFRSANELINTALAPYPDDLVIVTKVGPGRDAWGNWMDAARPDQLRGQVEENLRQLGRDHLDVVNLRRMQTEAPSRSSRPAASKASPSCRSSRSRAGGVTTARPIASQPSCLRSRAPTNWLRSTRSAPSNRSLRLAGHFGEAAGQVAALWLGRGQVQCLSVARRGVLLAVQPPQQIRAGRRQEVVAG
jgi:hypothetical protein